MFDVCTTGDTAHIDTIFTFLPHTRHHVDACVATTWIPYRCVPCHPWCTYRTSIVVKKNIFQFSCGCEQFHSGRFFGFLVINVCNHGENYETPCIIKICSVVLNKSTTASRYDLLSLMTTSAYDRLVILTTWFRRDFRLPPRRRRELRSYGLLCSE